MLSSERLIDPSWHPLANGIPPLWADGWGQDEYGVFVEVLVGEAELRLRWIVPGRFTMGSPEEEAGYKAMVEALGIYKGRESPQTEITFTEGFWLMDAPVTQALWQAVMGENPSKFVSPDRPVEQVSWEDAQAFIERINAEVPGLGLRLPSEAEWEYACRAGTETATYAGPMQIVGTNNAPVLEEIAWYGGNSGVGWDLEDGYDASDFPEKAHEFDKAGTRPVRLKQPNPWGCFDMLGNVWEWCEDEWQDSHEGASPDGGPRQSSPATGQRVRVVRGGSWLGTACNVRSAIRGRIPPEARDAALGFRCARGQVVSSGWPEARGPGGAEGG